MLMVNCNVPMQLAHGFIRATFQTVPVWFNEGLATYLGSLRMRDGLACFGGRDRMQSRHQRGYGRVMFVVDLIRELGESESSVDPLDRRQQREIATMAVDARAGGRDPSRQL